MRTAAGWAVIGVLGATTLATGKLKELFIIGVPPTVPAAEVASGPPDAATAQLITDLGSPDYRTREKAGKELEARGDKILPHLRRALAATDSPEMSRRLAVMIRRLDFDRLVAPRRVTLSVKDAPAKAVFDEIGKQTGYKIEFNGGGPGSDGKFSFEFDNAPFWQAVDRVADAAGLQVYANSGDDTIQVNSYGRSRNPYVCYAGPFRFVANSINSNKGVQLAGIEPGSPNRSAENINLNFQVYSEPKNPILGAHQAELTVATDETGASMLPPRNNPNQHYQTYYGGGGFRGYNTNGNVSLVRASRDATTLKALKGKMQVVLLAGTVPEVVVHDPMKVKSKTFAGRTVEVKFESMAEANGQYTVNLTFTRLGADGQNNGNIDWNWANSMWQKIEVTDAAGGRYNSYGPQNTNNNGHAVQMTIVYNANDRRGMPQKLGPPVKLVVTEWLSVTHDVTFEFKDIPLP